MKRLILTLALGLAVAGVLSACGKKGPPEAPGQDRIPRNYPAQT